MKIAPRFVASLLLLVTPAFLSGAEEGQSRTPSELFNAALQRVAGLVEPAPELEPQTFSARIEFVKSEGLPKELSGQSAFVAIQAPDRLTISAEYKGKSYALGRDQQEAWA